MPFVTFELGALFSFDTVIEAIQETFSVEKESLSELSECKQLFKYWYQWALHDYVACSHAGTYMSLDGILKHTLTRALKTYFDDIQLFAKDDQAVQVMKAFDSLRLRPQAMEALQLLNEQTGRRWDIYVVGPMSVVRIQQLLYKASIERYIGSHIMSLDELRISTPHPKVYSELMRNAVHKTKRIENFYIIGTKASDLAGAKNVSMRTVFLNTEEKVYTDKIYPLTGEPDITGDDLLECVRKMFDYERSKAFDT